MTKKGVTQVQDSTDAVTGDAATSNEGDVVSNDPKVKVVRMERKLEGAVGPSEADVHPDEVDNWKAVGWYVKG
jgi:hypothetical protein